MGASLEVGAFRVSLELTAGTLLEPTSDLEPECPAVTPLNS